MSALVATALNPLLTGPLLYLFTRAPPQLQERALLLLKRIPGNIQAAKLVTVLTVLLGLGLVKAVNNWANACALNGWRRRNDKERWNWPEEIAVVTGGCSGIGASVVSSLRARGVKVAILDVSPLPAKFEATKGIIYVKCDVTDSDAVHAAADEIRSKLGKPSILVNNAGIGASYPILSIPPEKLQKVLGVNLMSHWYTCAAFVPDMIAANKGHVITVASMASFITVASTSDYAASKAGVLAFHEALSASLRNEYKAPMVHTTSIHPSWVSTPLVTANATKDQLKQLGPLMNVDYVGNNITKRIFSCRGGQVLLPAAPILACFRALPNWIQDGIRDQAAKIRTN